MQTEKCNRPIYGMQMPMRHTRIAFSVLLRVFVWLGASGAPAVRHPTCLSVSPFLKI
jgi:hypothetical protein